MAADGIAALRSQSVLRLQAEDFIFRLTDSELLGLRSQSVISNSRGGRRYQPLAFTEQGVAMPSSVLRSETAVQVNVQIMRAFVRLRELAFTHGRLAQELERLRGRVDVLGPASLMRKHHYASEFVSRSSAYPDHNGLDRPNLPTPLCVQLVRFEELGGNWIKSS